MTEMNRVLDDPFYDNIDHALGRPKDPLGKTARNIYQVAHVDEASLSRFANPYWERIFATDTLSTFVVTHQGRWALHNYLKKGKS